jgi:DNA-binding HxlR family transcriptional regulator
MTPLPRGSLLRRAEEKSEKTFTELRHSLERLFKRTLSKPQLARLINTLEQLSLIEKVDNGYKALDPLIPDAAALLLKRRAR